MPKFGSYKYSARALSDKGVLVSWTGLTRARLGQDQLDHFMRRGRRLHALRARGATSRCPAPARSCRIEDLLQAQFEAHQFMNLFEGNLKLNVNLLLHLVYKKFYRTQ